MGIGYGSITVSKVEDGSQIWTTTTAPTTPNYTFDISKLSGDSNASVKPGDVIFYDYYRYTITSVGTTTVLAGTRQNLRGASGVSSAQVILYQRGATAPAKPSGDVVYTFATGVATGIGNWSQSIPSGTDPVWAITASASSSGATDTIPSSEWSAQLKIIENGEGGDPGFNQATVYLYKRDTSAAKPSTAVTYTFSTGALSAVPSGWSRTVPTANGKPCWVTTVAVISQNDTATITAASWATPTKLAEDGFSPTATVTKSGSKATITVTDAAGTTTEEVEDGFSPTATVTKSGSTATITIQDKNGTTSQTISDGASTYGIVVSHAAIVKDTSGNYTPAAITVKGMLGATAYTGRLYIETTADGSTWTARVNEDAASKTYTIPSGITQIRCSLYSAGGTTTLLDQQTVPVVSDGGNFNWNLIPHSRNFADFLKESKAVKTVNADNVVVTVAKEGTAGSRYGIYYDFDVETNTDYTVSFYAKDVTNWSYSIGGNNSGSIWNGLSARQDVVEGYNKRTFNSSTSTSARLYIGCPLNLGGEITLWNAKAEKGTVATDWCTTESEVHGTDGADAYTVILTNEAHTFAAGTSAAIAGNTTSSVITYKGATQVACYVGASASATSITTGVTGLTCTVANNNSKNVTLTIAATTSLTTKSGTFDVPITVDGKTFSKKFTFSLALTGTTGSRGATWYAGTAITGTSTTATIFSGSGIASAIVGDHYLNTSTQNVYRCTTAGAASVAKWVYEQNIKGTTGTPGLNGYVHIKYSDDGGSTFTGNSGEDPGAYIGTYTDNTAADSTSVSAYTWVKIEGDKVTATKSGTTTTIKINGTTSATINDGTNGTSVTVSKTEYQSGTSNTTAPTGTWSTTIPSVAEGNYLWTKVTYSDGKIAYSVAKQGKSGTSVTVSSTEYAYQLSTSGTTVPTGTWQTSPQAPTTTQFAWTRTITTFSDGSKATTYTVGGKTGTNGTAGGRWYSGTGITGTSTTATIFSGSGVSSAVVGDMYLNTSTFNTYRCTVAGAASAAKWVYVNNIKGTKGDKGDKGDDGITNGYTIIWDINASTTYAGGEASICAYDQTTGQANTSAAGWVMWNGTKRTVPLKTFNPNSMCPYNIPLWLVLRLSSPSATTGTIYPVWYDGTAKKWKNLSDADASVSGAAVQDWTWAEATDIVLGRCVEPASEGVFTDGQIFDPPYTMKQVSTSIITSQSAAASAAAAQTSANGANYQEQIIYISKPANTQSVTAPSTWVTDTTGNQATWTLKRPVYDTRDPVLFVATQRKTVGGTVTCTTPLKDDTTTVIDGGHITTGSIDASRITTGKLSADVIDSKTITFEKLSTAVQDSIESIDNLDVGERNYIRTSRHFTLFNHNLSRATYVNDTEFSYVSLNGTTSNWQACCEATYLLDPALFDLGDSLIFSFDYKSSAAADIQAYMAGSAETPGSELVARTKYCRIFGGSSLPSTGGEWVRKIIKWDSPSVSKMTSGSGNVNSWYLQLYNRTDNVVVDVRKWKVVFGTTTTDWTPAPEDAIYELEIGGRNYLQTVSPMGASSTTSGVTWTLGKGCVTLNGTSTSYGVIISQKCFGGLTLEPGTYSIWTDSDKCCFRIGKGSSATHVYSTEGTFLKSSPYILNVTESDIYYIAPIVKNGKTFSNEVVHFMLEKGNKPSDWSPAPEDTQADIDTALNRSVEYIVGTQTAATGSWTGVTTETALYTGKTIAYKLPYAGSGNATLELTLANGTTTTGAKAVYLNTTRVTTHFGAGSVIQMTYDGTNWRATSIPNSNTYDRILHNQYIKAAAAITAGHIICGTDSGYKNIAASLAFNLSHPLLYASAAIASGAQAANTYESYPSVNPGTSGTVQGLAVNKVVYLKGTVSGNTFTIAASNWLTCTIPTSVDNMYYIPLGVVANDATSKMFFSSSNRLFAYLDGKFQAVDTAAKDLADDAAKTATNYITYIDTTNGIRVYDGQSANKNKNFAQLNSTGMQVYRNNVKVASFGDTAVIGKDNTNRTEISADATTFYGVDNTVVGEIANGASSTYNNAFELYYEDNFSSSIAGKVITKTDTGNKELPIDISTFTLWVTVSSKYAAEKDEELDFSFNRKTSSTVTVNSVYCPMTIAFTYNASGSTFKITIKNTVDYTELEYIYIECVYPVTRTASHYSFGVNNSSDGKMSFAEGYGVTASGDYSHAEGRDTRASHLQAHAEGHNTIASGETSHAEGTSTKAGGGASHSEGAYSKATAQAAHSEGYYGTATGMAAHAEGFGAIAGGAYSHAQNDHTTASNYAETAIGKFNYCIAGTTPSVSTYGLYIGNGSSETKRSNALMVDWNGNVYLDMHTDIDDEGPTFNLGLGLEHTNMWSDSDIIQSLGGGDMVSLKDLLAEILLRLPTKRRTLTFTRNTTNTSAGDLDMAQTTGNMIVGSGSITTAKAFTAGTKYDLGTVSPIPTKDIIAYGRCSNIFNIQCWISAAGVIQCNSSSAIAKGAKIDLMVMYEPV